MSHEFGRYVRAMRVDASVSLRKAAKALDVSAVYFGEVERGVRPPFKEVHWDKLVAAIPTIERDSLNRFTVKARPVQLDLRDAPPQYQDLGMALARRIEKKNLSAKDIEKLFSILGDDK